MKTVPEPALAKQSPHSLTLLRGRPSNLQKFSYKLEYLLQFDQKEKTTFLGTRKDYWDYFSDCLAKIKGANDGIRFVKSIPELKTSLGKGRAFIRYSLVHQRLADTLQQCLMNQRVTSPDFGHGLLDESGEQCDPSGVGGNGDGGGAGGVSTVEDLRLELDRAELQQRELLERVRQMGGEGAELRRVVEELQSQLDTTLAAHAALQRDSAHNHLRLERAGQEADQRAEKLSKEAESLRADLQAREAESKELRAKLEGAEQRNCELLSRLEGALSEKGQQTASYFDSAQKIHDLLDKLNEAEKARLEALKAGEELTRQAERQGEELKRAESALLESEAGLVAGSVETARLRGEAEELRTMVDDLQGSLTLREKEVGNLQEQLRDVRSSLEEKEVDLERRESGLKEELESQARGLAERLRAREEELSASEQRARGLEKEAETRAGEKEALEAGAREQAKKMEEYKAQCSSLMELNGRLLQTVKRNEETARGLADSRAALERELAGLRRQLEEARSGAEERERRLREDGQRLEQENRELREEQAAVKGALASMQAELRTIGAQISELEGSLAASRRNEAELQERLREKDRQNQEAEEEAQRLGQSAERREEEQREQREAEAARLSRAEAQLELHLGEVTRLQGEVLELRAELRRAAEEEARAGTRLEASEAEKEELRALVDSQKAQLDELKRGQEEETQRWQEREGQASQELAKLKERHEKLIVEAADARESLHRANTEMAELGVAACALTSELEQARQEREVAEGRLRELEKEARQEAEVLQREGAGLREELEKAGKLPETVRELTDRLEKAEAQARSLQEAHKEEMEALRFQTSSEAMSYQNQIRSASEEVGALHGQLSVEQEKVRNLASQVSQLQAVNGENCRLMEGKDASISECQAAIGQKDEELQRLRDALARDKDVLWQKSDALEFEQKLRAEERWWLLDKEATHCLGCSSQFTWLLRRHHCRLCGRIFCYYCSNNFVMTRHSGKKERCCRDCYSQHMTDPASKPDDATFDIITEEEVNGIYDSDSLSQSTAESPERERGAAQPTANTELNSSTSTADTNTDDPEEPVTTVQDAEIYLLKSGELTSSCYSLIPMELREAGPTISWVFSSEPKSISFSVVYREGPDTPLEQAKVLIPLTRCDSHKETIQGQLKARKPGTYMLIFDNSFSRFISKKVLYHLTIEKPVIYDGSDFPEGGWRGDEFCASYPLLNSFSPIHAKRHTIYLLCQYTEAKRVHLPFIFHFKTAAVTIALRARKVQLTFLYGRLLFNHCIDFVHE
ncbi:hypothetical protein JZ751_013900, partial [Albula glossodonta]